MRPKRLRPLIVIGFCFDKDGLKVLLLSSRINLNIFYKLRL